LVIRLTALRLPNKYFLARDDTTGGKRIRRWANSTIINPTSLVKKERWVAKETAAQPTVLFTAFNPL
jgi:hypothetical protein